MPFRGPGYAVAAAQTAAATAAPGQGRTEKEVGGSPRGERDGRAVAVQRAAAQRRAGREEPPPTGAEVASRAEAGGDPSLRPQLGVRRLGAITHRKARGHLRASRQLAGIGPACSRTRSTRAPTCCRCLRFLRPRDRGPGLIACGHAVRRPGLCGQPRSVRASPSTLWAHQYQYKEFMFMKVVHVVYTVPRVSSQRLGARC